MKNKFSRRWIRSVQRRKQRKYRYNAPMHIRQKMASAHLSREMRKAYKKRSAQPRVNDEVKILVGRFSRLSGKITEVDLKKIKLYVDCAKIKKKSGQEVFVPIDPSNVMITKLNLEDQKRKKSFIRGAKKTVEVKQ